MRLIKKFWHGMMFFDTGDFDDWCIFLSSKKNLVYDKMCVPIKTGYGPKDYKIFWELKRLADASRPFQVYKDFIQIYGVTGPEIDNDVLQFIHELAFRRLDGYKDPDMVELLYCFLYACMVAEFHKARSPLNKRLKRLAVHQLLLEGRSVWDVTNFSKGRPAKFKKWRGSRSLDEECKTRGF